MDQSVQIIPTNRSTDVLPDACWNTYGPLYAAFHRLHQHKSSQCLEDPCMVWLKMPMLTSATLTESPYRLNLIKVAHGFHERTLILSAIYTYTFSPGFNSFLSSSSPSIVWFTVPSPIRDRRYCGGAATLLWGFSVWMPPDLFPWCRWGLILLTPWYVLRLEHLRVPLDMCSSSALLE